MKKWHYTSNIHDYIIIENIKLKLNTSYDNIFNLFKYLKEDTIQNKIEVFLNVIFFPTDYDKLKKLTQKWNIEDYTSLINHITKNVLFLDNSNEIKTKVTDIDIDSELVFASFYYDYGISLIEKKGKMTWKEFLILYENLSEESPLGRQIKLVKTDDKELNTEGRNLKRERLRKLNKDIDINKQIDVLTSFLKATSKKEIK